MFAYALLQCLNHAGPADLARTSGVSPARLEAFVDHQAQPQPGEVAALAAALGPTWGPPLVRAWLWEQCPPDYRWLVPPATVGQQRRRRLYRLLALAAAIAALAAAAWNFRYTVIPGSKGHVPLVLDRWTGATRIAP